jgi:hypothetical protein
MNCVSACRPTGKQSAMRERITIGSGMWPANYRDLAEFGLPFVTPEYPAFPGLVREIQSRPQLFGPRPLEELKVAAVLFASTSIHHLINMSARIC